MCEKAGIPTSTLVCEGFLKQAAVASVGLSLPNLAVAPVPGHPSVQTQDELQRNIIGVTFNHVIDNLTVAPAAAATTEAMVETLNAPPGSALDPPVPTRSSVS